MMTEPTGDAASPQDMDSVDHRSGAAGDTEGLTEGAFNSLSDALQAHQIPLENHDVIRRFTAALGITAFVGTSSYIKAVRKDGSPDLHIAHGYTNGFRSRDEAVEASGSPSVGASARGTGQWLVIHPLNSLRDGGGPSGATAKRHYETCKVCNTVKTASGSCLCD